ncbi:24234_t:CDS:2, partial [Cetraspora pellucida]
MAPIYTLYNESTDAKNFQERGYKLDSSREHELESQCNELLFKTEFFANKYSEIMFFKAKLVNIKIELDSKVSELEHPKSEKISISVVGGDSKKNISKSRPEGSLLCNNNIFAVSKTSKNLKSSKINTEVTSK